MSYISMLVLGLKFMKQVKKQKIKPPLLVEIDSKKILVKQTKILGQVEEIYTKDRYLERILYVKVQPQK